MSKLHLHGDLNHLAYDTYWAGGFLDTPVAASYEECIKWTRRKPVA